MREIRVQMERSLLVCLLLFIKAIQHGCGGGGLGGQLWCSENTYVLDINKRIFIVWPQTQAGQQARANCTSGTMGSGRIYRQCTLQGTWREPDFTQCTNENKDIDWNTLEAFKTGSPTNKTKDLNRVVGILEEIVTRNLNETADSIMAIIEVIMDMNKTTLAANGDISSRVLRILDLLAENIPTDAKTKTKLLKTSNLALQALDVNKEQFNGFTFGVTTNGTFSNNFENSTTSVKLSSSVLDNAGTGSVRIGFIYFKNKKLFQGNSDKEKNYITSEEVLSSTVYNVSTSQLADPVMMKFATQVGSNMGNRSCVFWQDKARQWSSAGCSLCPHQSTKDSVQCCCNHLTSFAVLFSPEKKPTSEDDGVHAKILSIITYVGCMISLLGVILTFLTYAVFRNLLKTNQQYILMNLCIAIALLLIVFVAGINSTNNILGCQIVAVLLQYLTLVTVLWMGIEAYNLYLGIVKVLGTFHNRFMLKAALVGWGVPLLIVLATVISAVVDYNEDINAKKTFKYGSVHACVLHSYVYNIIAWFVPILSILLFNVVVFIRVLHHLTNSMTATYNKHAYNTKKQCWTALAIMCLLGLTWLFGALAISDARIVFEYLFCIFNSLQGFFIFFFHCARIKEVRSQWSVFVSGLGFSRRDESTEGRHPRHCSVSPMEKLKSGKKEERNTPC